MQIIMIPKMSGNVLQDFYLFYDLKVLLVCKISKTLFPKTKIQLLSPNLVHFMYLMFERILLRWKFWGIPLQCNVLY